MVCNVIEGAIYRKARILYCNLTKVQNNKIIAIDLFTNIDTITNINFHNKYFLRAVGEGRIFISIL